MSNHEELDTELAALNAGVTAALSARKAWMDAHMADYARYKIGEVLYELDGGRELGTITRLYRYWDGRDPRYDTSMDVCYEYRVRGNCFDNTSRQPYRPFGNAADLAARRQTQLRIARLRADPEGAWYDAGFAL